MSALLDQFILFAEYNRLMNQRMLHAAGQLSARELAHDRGAFFKSILGTLNHILVGDIIWLNRFSAHPSGQAALDPLSQLPKPESLDAILYTELANLEETRQQLDAVISNWLNQLSVADINDSIAYTNMAGEPHRKKLASLISHLFLHQVHHRGQVTTLLSQCGIDFGDTDLLEIIAAENDTGITT